MCTLIAKSIHKASCTSPLVLNVAVFLKTEKALSGNTHLIYSKVFFYILRVKGNVHKGSVVLVQNERCVCP